MYASFCSILLSTILIKVSISLRGPGQTALPQRQIAPAARRCSRRVPLAHQVEADIVVVAPCDGECRVYRAERCLALRASELLHRAIQAIDDGAEPFCFGRQCRLDLLLQIHSLGELLAQLGCLIAGTCEERQGRGTGIGSPRPNPYLNKGSKVRVLPWSSPRAASRSRLAPSTDLVAASRP